MPDKRDMHQAKSHRNSRNKRQGGSPAGHGAQRPPTAPAAGAGTVSATMAAEMTEQAAAPTGKKNKNTR